MTCNGPNCRKAFVVSTIRPRFGIAEQNDHASDWRIWSDMSHTTSTMARWIDNMESPTSTVRHRHGMETGVVLCGFVHTHAASNCFLIKLDLQLSTWISSPRYARKGARRVELYLCGTTDLFLCCRLFLILLLATTCSVCQILEACTLSTFFTPDCKLVKVPEGSSFIPHCSILSCAGTLPHSS